MTVRSGTVPISVIIPAHNAADFLPRAIDSVRAQTRPPSEIIVVDDGSVDASVAIARDKGVQVLARGHAGVSATRNCGIDAATSPWLAFLDADDVWEPRKLERQSSAATLSGAGFVGCDQSTFDESHEMRDGSCLAWPAMQYEALERTVVAPGIEHISTIAAQIHGVGWFLFPSTVLVRRDLLLEVGLFDEGLTYCEDLDCFLRVLTRSSLAMVREPLARRRVHDAALTSNQLGMTLGRLAVVDRVLARPDRYPPKVAASMTEELPTLALEAARLLLHVGRRGESRRLLLRSLRVRPSAAALALLAASWLDPGQFQRLRPTIRRIRSLTGPGAPK